ncbi:glycosidase-like protein [Rhodovarius crocodyli]|uniref:Glycosidase-like protein n=1 Tax=Rhodovarius crocodyli TaxID=1979269 RepID=A0A437M2P2_9PROT|nr:glycosidase-like protein [Rhodovarius crocodyli]RVT91979.1 glycosidase-like protein [Rhodovarius crocodyli]
MLARRGLTLLLLPGAALAQGRAPGGWPAGWRGFNLAVTEGSAPGGANARRSLRLLRALGADSVAVMPFLWQESAVATAVVRGGDSPDPVVSAAIAQAREAGLRVFVKPALWVQGAAPGAIAPANDAAWRGWFAGYGQALLALARLAQQQGAEAFSIGQAIRGAAARPEWRELIQSVRGAFRGRLTYVAADTEEAEAFAHWGLLDVVSTRIFRPLGADDRPEDWTAPMQREAERLDRLEARIRKKIWVAELGIRSAAGAAMNPEEERASVPDQRVQAEALARWLRRLDRPSVEGVFLWRWFTDPARGGAADTDYTVQNKLAEGVLLHAWAAR